jgi:hypothetical protein
VTRRSRLGLLAAVVAVVIVLVGTYVTKAAVDATDKRSVARIEKPRATVDADQPRVVFRNTDQGSSNGLVAVVPLNGLSGKRTILGPSCDRVYATRAETVCLHTRRGVVTRFEGRVFDAAGRELKKWSLAGIPSRTRLSQDGTLVADTTFVTGHSYMQVGFSTATYVRRVDGSDYGNLERFSLDVDGRRINAQDRNIWGVTFASDGRYFYATAASRGRTWLVRGDLVEHSLVAVRRNAECPSLSPDGHKVAYKKRVPEGSAHWALAVLDLRSGQETVLGERRSVDDQVEWLDDAHLLYGLARSGQPGSSDVWEISTASHKAPRRVISDASSPSVVR